MKLHSILHTSLSTAAATVSVQAEQPSDRKGHRLPAGYPKTGICPRARRAAYKHKHFLTAIVLALAFCAASATAARPPKKLPSGMFSTEGNQIVDQHRHPVRLSCVYWAGLNGFDGTLFNFTSPLDGYQANINEMAVAGFNCIRVDFNNLSLHQGNVSAFLSSLDQVVAAASKVGLRVIIVDHDNEGNFGSNDGFTNDCAAQQSNGIWYDLGGASNGTDNCNDPGTVTQESYQSDWVSLASRYAGNDTVIGYDLWNEPLEYGDSTWGDGTDHDIHLMYETVGSAMLAKDPNKLIFAECPQNYAGTLFDGAVGNAPWGDCTGVRNTPVVFTVNGHSVTDKVVYDVHLYPNSVSGIASLFGGSSSSAAAIQAMNYSFGYLESENIAPVWDGESGTGLGHDPDDQDWANMLDSYLNGQLGSQGGPTFRRDQQGMGFAWEDWQVLTPGGLGIMNADGSLDPTITAIVDPLLYY
jgi:endoglucanase